MLDLDLARLSPEVAKIIMLRGARTPSLRWQEHQNTGAKKTLDAIDDARLFGSGVVINEGMAAATRSLLYLWNGWIGECKMYAQAVPEKERFHIIAFCERMEGNSKSAKECFQRIGESPVFTELRTYALEAISPGAAPEVHRFRKVLEQNEAWEPYAFCDLYMQVLSGQLGTSSASLVTGIQTREFALLFTHCYQAATGTDLKKRATGGPQTQARSPKLLKKRKPPTSRTGAQRAGRLDREPESKLFGKTTGAEKTARPAGSPPVVIQVKVICPSCREKLTFPVAARGKNHTCPKCHTEFLIPEKKGTGTGTSSSVVPENTEGAGVKILCPRCKSLMVFPDSARGEQRNCSACGTPFIVPIKKTGAEPQAEPLQIT